MPRGHQRACHPLTAETMTCRHRHRLSHRLSHRPHPISASWPLLKSAFSSSSSSICTRSSKQANTQRHRNSDARASLARYPRQPLPCVVCGRRARARQNTTTRRGRRAFCQNAPLVSGFGFRVSGSGKPSVEMHHCVRDLTKCVRMVTSQCTLVLIAPGAVFLGCASL